MMITAVARHCHRDSFFFFNDTATTEIYTLSLHDALPICSAGLPGPSRAQEAAQVQALPLLEPLQRSEEHTSELQSQSNLVCRLLLEKKNTAAFSAPPSKSRTL